MITKTKRYSNGSFLPTNFQMAWTQGDCEKAECGSTDHCLISTAIWRIVPDATFVRMKYNRLTITRKGVIHQFVVPNKALTIANTFDAGKTPKEHNVTFSLFRYMAAQKIEVTRARQPKVNANRKARAEKGKPDRTDYRNVRRIVAKKVKAAS